MKRKQKPAEEWRRSSQINEAQMSSEILYLKVAINNKASTAQEFFITAVNKHGLPSR